MMRIALTNTTGRWFNEETATKYEESQQHDGRNYISLATGSQWHHEALYRTAGGRWILNHWSQWQGWRETYEEVSEQEAVAWLIRNGLEVPERLAAHADNLEVK